MKVLLRAGRFTVRHGISVVTKIAIAVQCRLLREYHMLGPTFLV